MRAQRCTIPAPSRSGCLTSRSVKRARNVSWWWWRRPKHRKNEIPQQLHISGGEMIWHVTSLAGLSALYFFAQPITTLVLGTAIERQLSGSEAHEYRLALAAG